MRKYLPVLKQISLFGGIDETALQQLLDDLTASVQTYEKGEIILAAGSPAKTIGAVLKGGIQVCRDGEDGTRLVLAELGQGGLFGEAFACAGVAELPVTVYASTDSTVLKLDYEKIALLTSFSGSCHARLISNLLALLAQKNIYLTRTIRHLSKRTIRERLLSYLEEQSQLAGSRSFTIPFDRQALADYLCVDRSALSRELGSLRRDGLVESKKNQFKLF